MIYCYLFNIWFLFELPFYANIVVKCLFIWVDFKINLGVLFAAKCFFAFVKCTKLSVMSFVTTITWSVCNISCIMF